METLDLILLLILLRLITPTTVVSFNNNNKMSQTSQSVFTFKSLVSVHLQLLANVPFIRADNKVES